MNERKGRIAGRDQNRAVAEPRLRTDPIRTKRENDKRKKYGFGFGTSPLSLRHSKATLVGLFPLWLPWMAAFCLLQPKIEDINLTQSMQPHTFPPPPHHMASAEQLHVDHNMHVVSNWERKNKAIHNIGVHSKKANSLSVTPTFTPPHSVIFLTGLFPRLLLW